MAKTLTGKMVLVVEDDFLLAMDINQTLHRAEAQVIGPVGTVPGALDLMDQHRFLDAAVLDVNLGGQPVFPVAERLAGQGIPFLFATGYREKDMPKHFASAARVQKPYEPAQLLAALLKILQTNQARPKEGDLADRDTKS